MFVQGMVEGEWERRGGKDETENFEKKPVFFPQMEAAVQLHLPNSRRCPHDLAGEPKS